MRGVAGAELSERAPRLAPGRVGCTRRRGTTTVLALLYLVLFSAVALGFYAQTNLGAQVSYNEERVQVAQVAAESGLQYIRYQLSRVTIANTVPRDQILDEVYNQLSAALDGTANLGTSHVGFPPPPAARAINIPANATDFIKLTPDGAQFHATITELGGGMLRIKSTGRSGTGPSAVSRSIAMDFIERPRRSPVLDYGMAVHGTVDVNKSAFRGTTDATRGSLLSTDTVDATPVSVRGGTGAISGDVYLTHPTGSVTGTGSVAGISDPAARAAHVHANTPAPEFPTGDAMPYADYLVGKETVITGSSAASYLANIRVTANANPTFSGGGTYEGVILVEAPNQVTFASGSTIRGVIVVANPDEATATNKISFSGTVNFQGTQTLPDTFVPLKTMTGASVVAPNMTLAFSNDAMVNFAGSVLAKNVSFSGVTTSTVTVPGCVVLTDSNQVSIPPDNVLQISGAAPASIPVGFRFTNNYAPYPATYLEVAP